MKPRITFTLALLVACEFYGCREQQPLPPVTSDPTTPTVESDTQSARGASGLRFLENAQAAGVNSIYRDGSEMNFYAILESLGGGVGVLDYDRDGAPDLYFPMGGNLHPNKQPFGAPSRLFRQTSTNPQSTFTEVSAVCHGTSAPHYTHGCAVTDYDNDGWDDVLVTGYGGLQLFHNLGDGTFAEVSQPTGLTDTSWSSSAAWGDYNGDGANDLYVAHYVDWSPENDPQCFLGDNKTPEICPPRRFTGLPDILYLSDGIGGFYVPGDAFGDVSRGKGLGVASADIDLDGDLDIYVTNDTVMNSLLVNQGHEKLADAGETSGTGYGDTGQEDGSMGVDIADYNGDGLPDIWVTNYENETFAMYRGFDGKFFQHVSRSTGIAAAGGLSVGWGTVFADFDLDGDEDLFAGNGHVIRHPNNSPLQQLPLVLLNENYQRYVNVAADAGDYTTSPHMSRGVACSDLDFNGALDLVVSHINQPAAILFNASDTAGHWLEVELVGTTSSRWAEGAWLEAEVAGAKKQLRLKKGGTSYASTSDRRLHFGLANATKVDTLVVHWPSGLTEKFADVGSNQLLRIVEGAGTFTAAR